MSSKKISFLWKDKKRRNLVYRGCKEQVFPKLLLLVKSNIFNSNNLPNTSPFLPYKILFVLLTIPYSHVWKMYSLGQVADEVQINY